MAVVAVCGETDLLDRGGAGPVNPTQKEAFELALVHVTVGTLNFVAT